MGSSRYTPEQIKAMSERMKAMWASLSPEEHAARMAKFRDPKGSEHAHKQMIEFWANCTGKARAARCRQITNPAAQAKSHAAQRTPEFRERRIEWQRRMWADATDEERTERMKQIKAMHEKNRKPVVGSPIAPGLPELHFASVSGAGAYIESIGLARLAKSAASRISVAARGPHHSVFGYHWKYV